MKATITAGALVVLLAGATAISAQQAPASKDSDTKPAAASTAAEGKAAPAPQAAASLIDMDLGALTEVRVTSATKSEVSLQLAPNIVRVFTSQDIAAHSMRTVQDILERVPGVDIQQYRGGHQLMWDRGVQSRYNNKTILLVDGMPLRDGYYGNWTLDNMLPVESIDRVEVLNGPGSVLYGANGLSGVISITTKRAGKAFSLDSGSYGSTRANAQYNYKGLFANVSASRSDGFSPDYNVDGLQRAHNQESQSATGLVSYHTDNLNVMGSFTDYTYPYRYRESNSEYIYRRQPFFGTASYKVDLGGSRSLNVRGYYDHYDFSIDKTKFKSVTTTDLSKVSTEYLPTEMWGTDADFSSMFGKHEIVTGLSYSADRSRNSYAHITFNKVAVDTIEPLLTTKPYRQTVGVFANDVWHLSKQVLLTAGARYDAISDFDNQFSWRAGLTAMPGEHWYGKALYGTSYRIPVYREYIAVGNDNPYLRPETIGTFEGQVGYVQKHMDLNATFFYNRYKDFIQELWPVTMTNPDGTTRVINDETSFNGDTRQTAGVEVFGRFKPAKGLDIIAGYSRKLKHTETLGTEMLANMVLLHPERVSANEQEIKYLSDSTVSFSATYLFLQRVRVGVSGNYYGGRAVTQWYQADVAKKDPSNADGFMMTSIFGDVTIYKGLAVRWKVDNALDVRAFSPAYGSYGGPEQYDLQWPGRSAWLGLACKF